MALRIKEVLKEQNRTSKWLAEKLEITEPGVSLIITERVNVPLRRLEQIANILGVSIVELFEDYKKMKAIEKHTEDLISEMKNMQDNGLSTIRCPHCNTEVKLTITAK